MSNWENYILEGTELPILTYPHPTLSKVAKPVTVFDDSLRAMIKDMIFTMYKAPGIGLAAPQVGKSVRLFVVDIDYDRDEITLPDGTEDYTLSNLHPLVFINPTFRDAEGEILYEEGCLSLPGIYEEVSRANAITIDYQNMFGEACSLRAEGTLAVCLQHENDHLDGKVFIDRISFMKRNMIKKKFEKKKK